MATVPAPRTWTVGELLTAAKLNTDLRDGLNFLLAPPRAVLVKTTSQSVANTAFPAVTFNTEDLDSDGGHSNSTNPSRYTAQTAGLFAVSSTVVWDVNSTGARFAGFLRNGSGYYGVDGCPAMAGQPVALNVATMISLSVGDYIEIASYQSSGGSLDIVGGGFRTTMEVRWASS